MTGIKTKGGFGVTFEDIKTSTKTYILYVLIGYEVYCAGVISAEIFRVFFRSISFEELCVLLHI